MIRVALAPLVRVILELLAHRVGKAIPARLAPLALVILEQLALRELRV